MEMAGRLHLEVEGLAAMGALPVVMMVATVVKAVRVEKREV